MSGQLTGCYFCTRKSEVIHVWVEERNGKAKFVETFVDEMTGKRRKVSVTLDKNTAQNRKKAAEMIAQKWQDMQNLGRNYRLSEIIERYNDDCKNTLKKSTYRRNTSNNRIMLEILGDVYVDKLTAGYIRDKLISARPKAVTRNEYLQRFSTVIRWAYSNDYMQSTACIDKIKPFKDVPHRKKIEDKFLNKDQLNQLVNAAYIEHWELLIRFMALSGCRAGEAIALNVSDVDFSHKVIHISKTYDHFDKELSTPKTSYSERDIHMQPELYDLCRKILIHSKRMRLININSDNEAFILTDIGQRPQYFAFNKFFKKLTLQLFGRELTTHALRHTAASLWAEQGMSLEAISRRLGHSNSAITREIYLHVTDNMKKADAAEIDKVIIF